MIDVLMAPASIRNPTTTMKPWKSNLIGIGPTRYIEMPLIRLLKYWGRTTSGMSAYAKNDTSDVKSKE